MRSGAAAPVRVSGGGRGRPGVTGGIWGSRSGARPDVGPGGAEDLGRSGGAWRGQAGGGTGGHGALWGGGIHRGVRPGVGPPGAGGAGAPTGLRRDGGVLWGALGFGGSGWVGGTRSECGVGRGGYGDVWGWGGPGRPRGGVRWGVGQTGACGALWGGVWRGGAMGCTGAVAGTPGGAEGQRAGRAGWGAFGGAQVGAGSGGGWSTAGALPHGGCQPPGRVLSPHHVLPVGAVGAASGSPPRSPQQWQLPPRCLGPALISQRCWVLAGELWGGRALAPLSKTPSVPAETVPEAGGGRAAGCREPPPPAGTCPSADRCRAQPGSAKTSPSTFCAVPPLAAGAGDLPPHIPF